MTAKSDLDQVAGMRRQVAAHAQFPVAYWVLYGVALVLMAGLPIWMTWFSPVGSPYLTWVLAAIGLTSAAYSVIRRRRSGVQLRKNITAYPRARWIWLASLIVTLAGLAGIFALVQVGQTPFALGALAVVAAAVFVLQFRTRTAMRRDIEAGRVTP